MEGVVYRVIPSPIGPLLLAGRDGVLGFLRFPRSGEAERPEADWQHDGGAFPEATSQLEAYFDRKLRTFDLPLDPRGTPFQLSVWDALRRIPYGHTRTYGDLARSLERPTAFRAVGAANGRNPIPIIIPCHRAVGSDGSLTGFGGGLEVKQQLLVLEGAALL
jgi:methylated-DNA-[protein]-cysteine S-methyltransferase